jgi:hypothetical protein
MELKEGEKLYIDNLIREHNLPEQGFHVDIDVDNLTPEQKIWLKVGIMDSQIDNKLDDFLWLEMWNILNERASRL